MGGKNLTRVFLVSCWLILGAGDGAAGPLAGGAAIRSGPERSPLVVLSDEFFQAMQKLATPQAAYGDRQEPLLEQIALSSRFIVKTNFTLIQQNEKIIQLLEELNRKRPLSER